MTEKKAIKFLDNLCLKMTYEYEVATHSRREVLNQEYSAVFLAKEALEKQIPKRVASNGFEYRCSCEAIVRSYYNYCPDCGQALDWSDK